MSINDQCTLVCFVRKWMSILWGRKISVLILKAQEAFLKVGRFCLSIYKVFLNVYLKL